jgi:hypothetical protein
LIERRLNWKGIVESELTAIRAVIEGNIRVGLEAAQRRAR